MTIELLKSKESELREYLKFLWTIPVKDRTPEQINALFILDDAVMLFYPYQYKWQLKIKGQKWIDDIINKSLTILQNREIEKGGGKMGTLKEEARDYEPKQTKNIADLPEVDVNLELFDAEGKDTNGKVFKYKYLSLNGEEYRVPASVIAELQEIVKAKPDTVKIKVAKSGSGLNTKYKVIQL